MNPIQRCAPRGRLRRLGSSTAASPEPSMWPRGAGRYPRPIRRPPLLVLGARRAVEIARRAGAEAYAEPELRDAETKLTSLEQSWSSVAHASPRLKPTPTEPGPMKRCARSKQRQRGRPPVEPASRDHRRRCRESRAAERALKAPMQHPLTSTVRCKSFEGQTRWRGGWLRPKASQ